MGKTTTHILNTYHNGLALKLETKVFFFLFITLMSLLNLSDLHATSTKLIKEYQAETIRKILEQAAQKNTTLMSQMVYQ